MTAGTVVGERYRLIAPIGEGAMGSVWSATHLTLGHTVAIKFLHGSSASNAETRARFEREAKLAARLGEASRYITRVTDHGVSTEGVPFLVMELLQGEGLEVRLKREKRLPILLVARITTQLCRALHTAHSSGVVHRDLKPANVFLCPDVDDGVLVKLLDFGVAKAQLENEDMTTRAGALIGTPNYMSPEQICGEGTVDARSDLWAVAAIVYRMCVGRPPFGSGSLSELAMRIVSTEPKAPSELAPDLPADFDLWVKKGLAKRQEHRFQSARELADSLSMVAGVSATGSTGAYSMMAAQKLALQIGDTAGPMQATIADPNAEAPKVKRSRGGLWLALGAFAAVAIAGGAFLALRERSTSPTNAAPPAAPSPAKAAPPEATRSIDVSTSASTTASPTTIAPIEEPSASASTSAASTATPTAKPIYTYKPGVPLKPKLPTTSTTSATPTPTAATTTTTPPTTEATKSGDLWKKKDEM